MLALHFLVISEIQVMAQCFIVSYISSYLCQVGLLALVNAN